jgi:prepilin-type N-terminal cleavage/methylation domain-containing protein
MSRSRLAAADDGFTLVEILVVMLIIGILAAIGMGAFLNQRGKAQDAHAKSAVSTAAKAVNVWNTEHGTYDGADPADLVKIEPTLAEASGLAVEGGAETYKVSVDSAGQGGTFSIERTDTGELVRDCTNPGAGACLDETDALGSRW